MNAEIFAEWLRKQGHHIYKTYSSYWYDAGPKVLQAFPYHWLIEPSEKEINQLILRNSVMALRYSTPVDSKQGMISYHVVLDDLDYGFEKLRSQARNGVKRGLEKCKVERISFQRLAYEGWNLQQDTLERQDRIDSMRQDEWERICLAADGLLGFEAWGAEVEGELASTIIICRIDEKCYVPYAQSHRKFLSMHVNNALFFTASRDMLSRSGVTGIFFSLQSLDAPESVNEFKFRMNFAARLVRQRVAVHPILMPLANWKMHRMIKKQIERDPSNSFLAKVEGILRFYLCGRLSMAEQEWPECVGLSKEERLTKLDTRSYVPVTHALVDQNGAEPRNGQIPKLSNSQRAKSI